VRFEMTTLMVRVSTIQLSDLWRALDRIQRSKFKVTWWKMLFCAHNNLHNLLVVSRESLRAFYLDLHWTALFIWRACAT